MKLTWNKAGKKRSLGSISNYPNLPFERGNLDYRYQRHQEGESENKQDDVEGVASQNRKQNHGCLPSDTKKLAELFQSQGDKLAEEGRYREALGKWEAALNLIPDNAIMHEQKAQVLLELGDAWKALKAASRATELDPSWAEAWITLGRAQLNFGEPDKAIESFDRALAFKPDVEEAKDDRQTALQLVKRRKQLHSSGMDGNSNRFVVRD